MEPIYTPKKESKVKLAHLRVREELLSQILGGDLKPGDKLPAEPEIADRFGVARMTANKAILSLVADGWLSRSLGKGTFVTQRSSEIATCLVVFTPDNLIGVVENYYYGTLYWNIVSKMARLGIRCIPISACILPPELDRNTGIIAVNPSTSLRQRLEMLGPQGARIVVLGSQWPGMRVPFVDSDNVLGSMLAVNHLTGLGHKEIAFWGSYPKDTNTQDRVRGFRAALKAQGLSADPSQIMLSEGLSLDQEAERNLVALLKSGISALVAGGAHTAVHAFMIAQANGYDVPRDLSIIAYDDPAFLCLIRPGISTISQPLAEMALLACDLLLAPEVLKSVGSILDPCLVQRGSSGPAFS